jgi:hypothetical protein
VNAECNLLDAFYLTLLLQSKDQAATGESFELRFSSHLPSIGSRKACITTGDKDDSHLKQTGTFPVEAVSIAGLASILAF